MLLIQTNYVETLVWKNDTLILKIDNYQASKIMSCKMFETYICKTIFEVKCLKFTYVKVFLK